MIDKSRTPIPAPDGPGADLPAADLPAADLPAPPFTPVPRHYNRHDGWTPERQQGFIAALIATGSVKAAAHAVNMTPEGAYALRRHPQATSFRKAWEQALAAGVQRLEDLAMDRALNGQDVPVYSYGKLVGTRRVYNDRLIMFLLRNRAPARFARTEAKGPDAVAKMQERQKLERLRRQWRAEWQAEEAAKAPSTQEIRASLDAKLAAFRREQEATMSDRTRALYEQARASHEADRQAGVWREAEED
jgi:hypothetical protein